MALRRDWDAAPYGPEGLDLLLARRLAAHASRLGEAGAPRRRLGVEHEYAVFEGDRQVDFSAYLHGLGVHGRALHPVNRHLLLTPSGLALMADGIVAEVASPPEVLRSGFGTALDAWAEHGARLLRASLPASLRLLPGSTHLSVETAPARTDQIALWATRTFAPALMLFTDHMDSPGVLVRPRPGRFEFGGEFVDGTRLRAAATFVAGAVMALEAARRLPPAVEVTLEPARQRYGWYIDRTAFGPDLYREGRDARLSLSSGGTVTAQQHIEACWEIAREALDGLVSADDIDAVERMVRGDIPLPCEDVGWQDARPPAAVLSSPYARLDHHRASARSVVTVEPVTATWDFVAFRVARADAQTVVSVPEADLDAFTRLVDTGELDDLLVRALETSMLPRLQTHRQTLHAGVFTSVTASDALLPRDRVGVGTGPVSTFRPGKVEDPPPPPPPPPPPEEKHRTRFPWWPVALIGCIGLLGSFFFLRGGDDQVDPDQTPTPAASVTATATSTPGVAPQPPAVGPIRAVLAAPVTTYTVEASSPAGRPLTYRWSLVADPGQDCGRKTPASNAPVASPSATWSHDNAPPDSCQHNAADHPFTVTVEVSDSVNPPVKRTYRGSNTGTGPVP